MNDGDKLIANVPLRWKNSVSMGVVIPHKMRNCNTYRKDTLCDGCEKLVKKE